MLINFCLKINATGNPGCTLFNSECTISAGNTLRIGPVLFIDTDTVQQNSEEQNCVDWTERALTTALKDTLMKKHTALKQDIKNGTCIEFRCDIKALTLLVVRC